MSSLIFVIVFVLIILMLPSIFFDYAEAIEFKKYKVINSPKVCGDKMCSEIDEVRAKQGLSSRNIPVCGDQLCNQIILQASEEKFGKQMTNPLTQFKFGVPLNLIKCREGLTLILKEKDMRPACVKIQTAQKLIEKGWAMDKKEFEKILSISKEKFESTQKEFIPTDFGLSVTAEKIDGKNFLIIEGFGWHRLHNVEIFISNEIGFETSIRSKTSDSGDLHMPWPIPAEMSQGMYTFHASDGLKEFKIKIPIAGFQN